MKNMEIKQMDLSLSDVNQYTCSEQYHNVLGINVTDGVAYIMTNGYSWFVTDFLSLVLVKHKSIQGQEFLAIKLKLNNGKGLMEVSDGNKNVLYTQEYKWTNAEQEVTLFYTNDVLLLDKEY
jgi:hypothetical protein